MAMQMPMKMAMWIFRDRFCIHDAAPSERRARSYMIGDGGQLLLSALSQNLKCNQPGKHDGNAERLQRRDDLAEHKATEDRRCQRLEVHDHCGAEGADAHRR